MTENLTPDEFAALKHWSTYGRPGEPPAERVKPSDRKTHLFKKRVQSVWNVPILPDQLPKLLNGFLPRQMEDKWVVYADGPDAEGRAMVHMIRSWTRSKIIEIVIDGAGNYGEKEMEVQPRITGITWESSKDVVRIQDEKGAKAMARETCNWVLGVALPEEIVDQRLESDKESES